MNKQIIGFGLIILLFAVLFPPIKYVNGSDRAFSNALDSTFGGTSSESNYTNVTIRPIWNIEGEYPMDEERVYTEYWIAEFIIISVFIMGISYLVGKKKIIKS